MKNWLDPFLKAAGVSQEQLAERMGKSRATVNRIANGHTKLNVELARELARALNNDAKVLLEAGAKIEDPERIPVDEFDSEGLGADFTTDGPGLSTLRPYRGSTPGAMADIDSSAGAGPGGLSLPASDNLGGVIYSADAVRGEISMPDYLLSEFTRAHAPRVHWIKIRGDSMEPTLLPGERVMVDTTDTAIGQGGVFVVRDPDGEIVVKRLRKLDAGRVELVSDNPKQGNRHYDGNDLAIIGRVVGRLSKI